MKLKDYAYLGLTQSLCPECLQVVPAKIIEKNGRVYFRKRCKEHGTRDDFVCSDVRMFDQLQYSTPGKIPNVVGVQPEKGCPYDCGLCTDHEQHTCIALLEITQNCNLTCPMCFAGSKPGQSHVSLEECKYAIDRLVRVEGKPEVLQLSGGEPTIHPDFFEILDYACSQPIDIVMVNTNGVRIAKDKRFAERLSEYRDRVEVYLQFDGFTVADYVSLRGTDLLDDKLKCVDTLGALQMNTTLVCTVQAGVNEDEIGAIVRFALDKPQVTGVSFQPATYTGRFFLPEQLENRVTFPDVIQAVASQAPDCFDSEDFLPLPCAHPNGHSLTYAYRESGVALPLTRMINVKANMDLLANGIVFTRERAKQLISEFLGREGCGDESCDSKFADLLNVDAELSEQQHAMAIRFFEKSASLELSQQDLLRITITSFMDAYNFDIRQVMKSCVHHLLPSGHLIPFSAYNVLYRDGHVPLPTLTDVRRESQPITQTKLPVAYPV